MHSAFCTNIPEMKGDFVTLCLNNHTVKSIRPGIVAIKLNLQSHIVCVFVSVCAQLLCPV